MGKIKNNPDDPRERMLSTIRKHVREARREAYNRALLDLLVYFGEYKVPFNMNVKDVQDEIIKFMEKNNE